jgi:hypothetical protein
MTGCRRITLKWTDNYACSHEMRCFSGPAVDSEMVVQVGKDPRVVLEVVYDAIKAGTVPQFLTSSSKEDFYLNLYRGLYFEAQGESARSAEEMQKAIQSRCAELIIETFTPVGMPGKLPGQG